MLLKKLPLLLKSLESYFLTRASQRSVGHAQNFRHVVRLWSPLKRKCRGSAVGRGVDSGRFVHFAADDGGDDPGCRVEQEIVRVGFAVFSVAVFRRCRRSQNSGVGALSS